MDKIKTDDIIKKRFKHITNDAKIMYYRNPRDCNNYMYEYVNPNHIGIIYGRHKKSKSLMMIAKVFMGIVPLFKFSFIDFLIVWFMYLISVINPMLFAVNIMVSIATVIFFYKLPYIIKFRVRKCHVRLSVSYY